MKVKLAKNSGFCFGVRRAVNMTLKELEANNVRGIYSIGHIIHNRDVVSDLSGKGLKVIDNLKDVSGGTLIIRCHGLAASVIAEARNKGLKLVDTTCPYVFSSHRIVNSLLKEGYHIIVVGDKNHPEIQALCDADGITVVDENTDFDSVNIKSKKVGFIAQTTLPFNFYKKTIRAFLKKGFVELRIFNTICNDTKKRQLSAKRLAKSVDCILVVGGRFSANSKRLYQICKKINPRAYHIENSSELNEGWFLKEDSVGIVSGASTPDYIIKQVADRIGNIDISCKKEKVGVKS